MPQDETAVKALREANQALEAAKPTLVDGLARGLHQLMKMFSSDAEWDGKKCWGHSRTGYLIHIAKENC